MTQVRDFTELKNMSTKYEEMVAYLNRKAITLGIETDNLFAKSQQAIKLLQTHFHSRYKQGGNQIMTDEDLRFLWAGFGILAHAKRELEALLSCASDYDKHRKIFDATVQAMPRRLPAISLAASASRTALIDACLAYAAERDIVRQQSETAFSEAERALLSGDLKGFNQSFEFAQEFAEKEQTLARLIANRLLVAA